MSAQQLADACAQLGLSISRSALANFESGRRPTVSVAEVTVLGKALGVPPIELIFPVGRQELVEVLPGQEMGTWQSVKWFAGEDSFAVRGPDGKWYVTDEDEQAHQESAVFSYRWHGQYEENFKRSLDAAKSARRAAGAAESDAERDAHLRTAAAEDRQNQTDRKTLREHRDRMRRDGLTPPATWGALADIDDAPKGAA